MKVLTDFLLGTESFCITEEPFVKGESSVFVLRHLEGDTFVSFIGYVSLKNLIDEIYKEGSYIDRFGKPSIDLYKLLES